MSDNEIEDVSFLPDLVAYNSKTRVPKIVFELLGESLHRKAVYEPSIIQKLRLTICTKGRATVLAVIGALIILVIALAASLANCRCPPPLSSPESEDTGQPAKNATEDFIATNGEKFPYKFLRLPHSVIPSHYALFLHPNITRSYFKGSVKINCEIRSSTDFIVFHSKELNITGISVSDNKNGNIYHVEKYLEYVKFQQIYVKLESSLAPGTKIIVDVSFEGQLIGKLAGFYKSSYKSKNGEMRHIATTHFEATDARAAFPCFDEPQLKATFQLSMIRDSDHVALFNMPISSTLDHGNGLKEDRFEVSVKMSTYLVAFIVCDYKRIYKQTKTNITVSVYAPEDFIESAKFALSTAVKVLEYYEQFFNVKYPLPKQDLIAIPDFEAGAMENWGLITYRMTAVLYDPKVSSAHNQQWVAVVIAHELAHQWFGNLVTMQWWDDLWLNEGFASYVEYIGSSKVDESWKMKDQFVYESLVPALRSDSLTTSHPINLPVENPNQINEIFDSITYDKGASIIRMLSNFMGDDVFNKGLTSYLNRYKFANAATKDLWNSLQQAVVEDKRSLGTNVDQMMKTWTEQMGYPLITLSRTGTKVTVSQSRFLLYQSENVTEEFESPYGYKWEVPFTYSLSTNQKDVKKLLLKDATATFDVPMATSWIKGNCGMYGFYRVNYDESGWSEIIRQLTLDPKVFTSVERAGIIDDAFALARAGLLKYKLALQLTQYMVNEEDFIPWAILLENMGYIQARFENKPAYSDYKKYMLKLLKKQLDTVIWEDEGTNLEKYLRAAILRKAVHLGHKKSVQKGRELFEQWKNDSSSINVNLKTVIYLAGIEYGNEEDWEMVWARYQTEMDASEKRKLLAVLGFSRDARLLSRLLDYSIEKTKVKTQDSVSVVSMVTSSLPGEILAWRFVQQHWDLFYERYGTGGFTMTRLIHSVANGFDTKFDLKQVEEFFLNRDTGSGQRAVKQGLEKVQTNIDWLSKYEKEISDWFSEHGQ